MRFRKPLLVSAVAASTAVLVLAVTLLVSRGVVEALVLVLVVAALAALYRLRRYAREELVYRRRTQVRAQEPRSEARPGPVSSGSAGGLRLPDRIQGSRPPRRARSDSGPSRTRTHT
jgi:hypothetical protein